MGIFDDFTDEELQGCGSSISDAKWNKPQGFEYDHKYWDSRIKGPTKVEDKPIEQDNRENPDTIKTQQEYRDHGYSRHH